MIVVKLEMWPLGNEEKKYPLGEIRIMNDGKGDFPHYGNYKVDVKHGGKFVGKKGSYRKGFVEKFKRTLSPYHLLARALKSCNIY
jgi:hypothetical protein